MRFESTATLHAAADRTASVVGVGGRAAWWLLALGVVAIGVVAGLTSAVGAGPAVLGAAVALPIILASFRWPLIPLFAIAILTPIEELVVVGSYGSLSRYAEILFILAYGLPRLGRIAVATMPAAGWGYVAWAFLSVVWALDRNAAIAELPILGLLFTTALVLAVLVSERPSIIRPLLWAYSLSALATAAIGLVEFLASGTVTGPNDRAAPLQDQNPAYYAAILLPAFIFALQELLNSRLVALSAATVVVTAGAIAVSGTRAAWLGAVVVVLLIVLPRLTPARRMAAIGLIGVGLIGAVQVPAVMTLITDRAVLAISTGGAGRTDIWTVGLTIAGDAPFTGVGLANFASAYTPERVRESDVGIYSAQNPAYRAPHNIAIGTLAELGPLGVALLAGFLAPLVLRRGWGPDAALVQAALASLLTTAFFLDLLNRKQLWMLIGMAAGLAYLRTRERRAAQPVPAGSVPQRR